MLNDYKVIMQLLETKLHDIHAMQGPVTSREPAGDSSSVVRNTDSTEPAISAIEPPFAKVSNVVAGSPAEEAGLQQDDQIRKFGNVTWLNHENLSRVKHVVQSSEGVSHLSSSHPSSCSTNVS
jgi:26S proteasome non-ATPase regulatory subunit 9